MGCRPKPILANRWTAVGLAGTLALGGSLPCAKARPGEFSEDVIESSRSSSPPMRIASVTDLSSLSVGSTVAVEEDGSSVRHPAGGFHTTGWEPELLAYYPTPGFRSTGLPELRPPDAGLPAPPFSATAPVIPYPASGFPSSGNSGAAPAPIVRAVAPHTETSAPNVQKLTFKNLYPDLRDFLKGYGVSMGMRAGVTYDDNINLGGGAGSPKESSMVFTLSPYIRITRGGPSGYEGGSRDSFSLQYSPSFVFYNKDSNLDDAPQSVDLSASILFSRLQLTLDQQILFYSDAAFQQGDVRDERKFYTTNIGAYYALTPKLQITSALNFGARDIEEGFDNYSVSASASIYYAFQPKLSFGPGVVAGWDFTQGQPSQPFQQVNLGLKYDTLHKLSFNLTVGVEYRELSGNNQTSLVFSGVANYLVSDRSSLSLEFHRRNSNSSVPVTRTSANNPVNGMFDENYTSTGATLSFTQSVLQRLSVTGSLAYENSAYYNSSTGNMTSGRNFNYFSGGITFTLPIADWASVNASYFYRQNAGSNDLKGVGNDAFNFRDNQVSFYISLQL